MPLALQLAMMTIVEMTCKRKLSMVIKSSDRNRKMKDLTLKIQILTNLVKDILINLITELGQSSGNDEMYR